MSAAWAPLARKFIAHRRKESLVMAQAAAQEADIADLLEAWSRGDLEQLRLIAPVLVKRLQQAGRAGEALTAALILLDPLVALVEQIRRIPVPDRNQALQTALRICPQARELARRLDDRPCEAAYLSFAGRGCSEARQLSSAREAYEEALTNEHLPKEIVEFLRTTLLPQTRAHVEVLDRILQSAG